MCKYELFSRFSAPVLNPAGKKTLQVFVFFWHLKNSLAALHVNYEGKIKVFKKLLLSYISFLFTKILGEKKNFP